MGKGEIGAREKLIRGVLVIDGSCSRVIQSDVCGARVVVREKVGPRVCAAGIIDYTLDTH